MTRVYDVVVGGGGMAGLTLALELKSAAPDLRVLVADKATHPPPDAAWKVGESCVEVSSRYLHGRLGLGDALAAQLPKFGLRFFFSRDDNRRIETRFEVGPSHYLSVPAFHVDRGSFEAALSRRCLAVGVEFRDACRVEGIDLDSGDAPHRVRLQGRSARESVLATWFIDASGRASLLKRKLSLHEDNRHDVNAVWFRMDARLDPDDWCSAPSWRGRVKEPRRYSTNHLMGPGYWTWLIPLAKDRTSVGIVADEGLHPFAELNTFEKAFAWLRRYEPQCADAVAAERLRLMDFRALRHYSHGATRVFSGDRWALAGESGVFVDPFYSPGGDFIGMGNGLITDLVLRHRLGEDIRARADVYDRRFRGMYRGFMTSFERQYPIMGSAAVMAAKIVWDFSLYWGIWALLYYRHKLEDLAFMAEAEPLIADAAFGNVAAQSLLREWHQHPPRGIGEGFVDYAEIACLSRLNAALRTPQNDGDLLASLRHNGGLLRELREEITAARTGVAARTAHLGSDWWAAFGGGAQKS